MSARKSTEEEREKTNPYEFYRTPPWAIWGLLSWWMRRGLLTDGTKILDACAGDGSIILEISRWSKCNNVYLDLRAIEIQEKFRPGLEETLGAGRVRIGSFLSMEPTSSDAKVDIVVHNPPFSLAGEFIMQARKWLRPEGSQFMLQRTTWPCETETGRYLQLYDPDAEDPIAKSGYRGELTGLNRMKFLAGGSDNINHSWFWLQDGHRGRLPVREYFLRKPCPWDNDREPENPKRGGYKASRKQENLFNE